MEFVGRNRNGNPQNRVNFLAKENTTNGYVIANVRLGYSGTIQQNNFSINVGVENIFDKAYKEHLDWSNIKRQGRNFYTVFNFIFRNPGFAPFFYFKL
jgi:iron complex outermembrane receptor protein